MRAQILALAVLALAGAARAQPAPSPTPSDKTPGGKAYDARLRDSFDAAEAYQGPLDGGWTLTAENQGAILDLRFEDHEGRIDGAWRDLRRPGALGASGVIDKATRVGDAITLEFSTRPGVHDVLSLTRAPGGWTGELTEAGKTRAVRLSKTSP